MNEWPTRMSGNAQKTHKKRIENENNNGRFFLVLFRSLSKRTHHVQAITAMIENKSKSKEKNENK